MTDFTNPEEWASRITNAGEGVLKMDYVYTIMLVQCELCTEVWTAAIEGGGFPNKLQCPNCDNMVDYEIKEVVQ